MTFVAVTGGASGIGEAVVRRLAGAEHRLRVLDRTPPTDVTWENVLEVDDEQFERVLAACAGISIKEYFLDSTPQTLRAMAEPSDVADAVGFLLSPDASMVTGHVLPVDAGQLSVAGQPLDGFPVPFPAPAAAR